MNAILGIIIALLIIALAWLWRRQNRRAADHQKLIDVWQNTVDAYNSLILRVEELEQKLEEKPARKPASKPRNQSPKRKKTRSARSSRAA